MKVANKNSKIPFVSINFGAGVDCPARKLGLCQAGSACYNLKSERRFYTVVDFRREQRESWDTESAFQIAMDISASRKPKQEKVLRFSVAGDFRDQEDVDKLVLIVKMLATDGWTVYGYTARTDLSIAALGEVANVNVSNDLGNYYVKRGLANRFKIVEKASGKHFVCAGDCSKCDTCRVHKGLTIEVARH